MLISIFLALPPLASAQTSLNEDAKSSIPFNANYIIDDYTLLEYQSMSRESIKRFLGGQSGILSEYKTKDIDGVERSATEIIWRASQAHGINPKFLIVLLQKEQSLIENPNPSLRDLDWATGYAVCDSCRTDDPGIQKFRGFATQVDRAAWRQKYYIAHSDEFAVKVGLPSYIDGVLVTPANQATANLYIYTPHLHGNQIFWNIWQKYFSRNYPDGTLLKERESGDIWLLTRGKLRPLISTLALYSDYDINKIITVSANDILRYDIGLPIKYPNYSLLRSPRGTVYLLVDEKRRGIASKEIFRGLGFNPEEVIDAKWDDLNLYAEGVPITTADAKPLGELLQDNKTGGVYYVSYGVKHPIKSREILKNRFAYYPIAAVSPAILDKYYTGDAVKFKDAELIVAAGEKQVYVIADGYKRPIVSAEIFEDLGYQWSNIVSTTAAAVNVHPDGVPVTG